MHRQRSPSVCYRSLIPSLASGGGRAGGRERGDESGRADPQGRPVVPVARVSAHAAGHDEASCRPRPGAALGSGDSRGMRRRKRARCTAWSTASPVRRRCARRDGGVEGHSGRDHHLGLEGLARRAEAGRLRFHHRLPEDHAQVRRQAARRDLPQHPARHRCGRGSS